MTCNSSPDGKHLPYADVVEVIVKGKKEYKMVTACWWCGKVL